MAKVVDQLWQIDDWIIPIQIHVERRASTRISISRDKAIMRVPITGSRTQIGHHESWAREWLHTQLRAHPKVANRFKLSQYDSGDLVRTQLKTYILDITKEKRSTSTAKIVNTTTIEIKLNDALNTYGQQQTIQSLFIRMIGKDQYNYV